MKPLRLFLANVATPTPTYPQVTPPMGILYLAAYLRTKFDMDIKLVNQRLEKFSMDELVRQAVEFDADVVGFSCLTPSGHHLGPLSRAVRAHLPEALILFGGPHCQAMGAAVMDGADADAAVAGEGELSAEMLLRARFEGDGDFSAIPGLIWRNPEGEVLTNPGMAPMVEDLDSLPFPAYDLIDLKPYWRSFRLTPVPSTRYAALVTSRGCPYQCNYCHRIFGKRWRAHSVERVIEEMDYYQKNFGVDTFELIDDVYNLKPQRALDISQEVTRRNWKIRFAFPNGVRSDILTEEVVDAIVDMGTYHCVLPLESGSPRIQKLMGKRLNIDKYLRSVEWVAARGVLTHGMNMLGFPTETEEELQMTIDVATNSRLHIGTFQSTTPYPNTDLYRWAVEHVPERIAGLSYRDMDLCSVRVNLSSLPDELFYAYQRKANRQFYMKPSRLSRILRDYPHRRYLPYYMWSTLMRGMKGLFDKTGQ